MATPLGGNGSPANARGPGSLKSFVSRSFAGTVVAIGLASGVIQFRSIIDWTLILIIGLGLFALAGWAAALYVAYSAKFVVSPVEALLESVTATISVPFVDSWLRATLLNQRAVDEYWHRDGSLKVEEIVCRSEVSERDVRNVLQIRGRNEAKVSVGTCPILFIGGSVLHFEEVIQGSATTFHGAQSVPVNLRSILDLGQLQLAEMVFPTLLQRHERFNIEQVHNWPGAMTPRTDIMWYPYSALFSRDVEKLTVSISFDRPVTYIRGYKASLASEKCLLHPVQPTAVPGSGNEYSWVIDDVDSEEVYALVFDR